MDLYNNTITVIEKVTKPNHYNINDISLVLLIVLKDIFIFKNDNIIFQTKVGRITELKKVDKDFFYTKD